MEMVELNNKTLESRPATFTVDQDEVVGNLYYFALIGAGKPPYRTQRHVNAILDIADDGTLSGVELIDNMPPPPAALPAPDDGLVEKLLEAAEDWRRLSDPENEELTLAASTALQSQTEQIERLSVQLEASALVGVEISSRLESAEQQVQKLTAENERLRVAVRSVISAETVPVHVGYDSGSGGGNYVYADAVRTDSDEFQAARSALETQEGGK